MHAGRLGTTWILLVTCKTPSVPLVLDAAAIEGFKSDAKKDALAASLLKKASVRLDELSFSLRTEVFAMARI